MNHPARYILLLVLAFSSMIGNAREPVDYGRYAPSTYSGKVVLESWNTPEGLKRLTRAGYSVDFHQLAHHYQPQINGLYCGIASSVIVLNALRTGKRAIPSQRAQEVPIPPAFGGGTIPYTLYAQTSFLNERTDRIKPRAVIEFRENAPDGKPDPGLTLQQLKGVLEAYGAKAVAQHADADEAAGIPRFREALRAILGEPQQFLIVNYDSRKIGQAGGGHISPLGAYDAESDSVLILDVSGQLNPWLWVPLRELYLAMHTLDGERYRGWVIVGEGAGN